MKNALIIFNKNRIDTESVKYIIDFFNENGVDFSSVDLISDEDENSFRIRLTEYATRADNLITLVGDDAVFDYKSVIAEVMETELSLSDGAKELVERVSKITGKVYSEEYARMPIEATVIPNPVSPIQGFMMEDRDFTLIVLPKKPEEAVKAAKDYVLPYFATKYRLKREEFVFKFFGVFSGGSEKLYSAIQGAEETFPYSFEYFINCVYGDYTVRVVFSEGVDGKTVANVKRYLVERLKDNIYAEFETSLSERVFDLLKLKNKKISTAESFTGGRVVSSIISNPGASAYVDEGAVTYSNRAKMRRLGVKEEDLKRVGAVSTQVAFQMAAGLIINGDCDIAVSTTGIAGPKSDDTEKSVGLCYIGVGMRDGVHVYKYNLKGDREEITETAKNTALFLVINKLKNI